MKFPLGLYRISGNSMAPTLAAGQLVIGRRRRSARPGDVIVTGHTMPLIKRLIRIDNDGLWVEGDNPDASTDSRHFGPLAPDHIEAVIIWPRLRREIAQN